MISAPFTSQTPCPTPTPRGKCFSCLFVTFAGFRRRQLDGRGEDRVAMPWVRSQPHCGVGGVYRGQVSDTDFLLSTILSREGCTMLNARFPPNEHNVLSCIGQLVAARAVKGVWEGVVRIEIHPNIKHIHAHTHTNTHTRYCLHLALAEVLAYSSVNTMTTNAAAYIVGYHSQGLALLHLQQPGIQPRKCEFLFSVH